MFKTVASLFFIIHFPSFSLVHISPVSRSIGSIPEYEEAKKTLDFLFWW